MNTDQFHFNNFIEAFKLFFPHTNVLHVFEMGAKDCADTLRFHNTFPQAEIFCFECNRDTLPICRKVVAGKEKIHLTEKAVSDLDGSITFYPIDTEKTITIHKDGNPGASSIFKASGKYPLEQYVQKEDTVSSVRLDTFMRENNLSKIDILWLDTQGSELKILQGLGDKLGTVKMIHTEVEFMEIYSGQPLFKEIRKFLNDKGFAFAGFSTREPYFADAVFISKAAANSKILWSKILTFRTRKILMKIKRKIKRTLLNQK